jgi:hypothetical protein
MHDMWFGLLNGIYGRTAFIDQPLIYYRRHGGNVSPMVSAPALKRLSWRWHLMKNLAARVVRDSVFGVK